ncbi:phosphodiester glycosidase family protein [Rhizobium leguminosarum]|uniref:phosphodiester glycosidase family protein n=1 Tax=Rhizobium leguminosarum TaxID=384 RepID=UPI001C9676A5|nr:phosphodiester glycosidase family protein [Rhizobium leguminosarum]MBY5330949.1 phosphodiester glycosidase family protein [Rhizobium leguminosarum]
MTLHTYFGIKMLEDSDLTTFNRRVNRIVVLVHGIRTRAWWQTMVAAKLETAPNISVIPLKYGYFDALRFWVPLPLVRRMPIRRLEKELDNILSQYASDYVFIIAHSYGTYAISKILYENPHYKIHGLILCGSIIPRDFDWHRIQDQVIGKHKRSHIINECGTKDFWPVLAQSATWGYGSSGTDGFGSTSVRDRFHEHGHSGYFNTDFVDRYWIPFVHHDKIETSLVDEKGAQNPGWLRLCRFPYRWLIICLAGVGALLSALSFGTSLIGPFDRRVSNSVKVSPVQTDLTGTDALWLRAKIESNLIEFLHRRGVAVTSDLTAAAASDDVNAPTISGKIISDKRDPSLNDIVSLDITYSDDGKVQASTSIEGTLADLKDIYKSLPEAALYGLRLVADTSLTQDSSVRLTDSPLAYGLWAESRRVAYRHQLEKSEALLRRAVQVDTRFAAAYWAISQLSAARGDKVAAASALAEANSISLDYPKIPVIEAAINPVPALRMELQGAPWRRVDANLEMKEVEARDYDLRVSAFRASTDDYQVSVVPSRGVHGTTIEELRKSVDGILAVNGGFFEIDSHNRLSPSGLLIVNGNRLSDYNKDAGSGILTVAGNRIDIVDSSSFALSTGLEFALQSGPRLVEKGGKIGIYKNDFNRLERAAICVDRGSITIVIIQGVGLSLYEVAGVLAAPIETGGFGCAVALNLDGGPSAQLSLKGSSLSVDLPGLWKINAGIVLRRAETTRPSAQLN